MWPLFDRSETTIVLERHKNSSTVFPKHPWPVEGSEDIPVLGLEHPRENYVYSAVEMP